MSTHSAQRLLCLRCRSVDGLRVLKSVYTRYTGQLTIEVCIVECSSCQQVAVVQCTDDQCLDKNFYQLFPSDSGDSPSLPRPLHESLNEARQCFEFSLFLACTVMCRRCLDLVCEYHGKTTGNLASRVQALHVDNIINDELNDWASNIRLSGNRAAHHRDFSPTRDEAREVFFLTGCVVHFVYCSATARNRWCMNCGHNLLDSRG